MSASKMHGRWTLLAALVLVCPLAGCGLIGELESSQMAVGLLLQSPDVADPQHPGQTIKGATAFSLEFASVNISEATSNPSQAATPTDGATVVLNYHDAKAGVDRSIPVQGMGNGTYLVTSAQSTLIYQQGQPYTVQITYSGKTYQMQVTPPAPIGLQFQSPTSGTEVGTDTQPVLINYQAGTPLTLARVPSTDTSVAFWQLASVSSSGSPQVVATNAPQSVSDFANLVIVPMGTAPYQYPTFTIQGSSFTAQTTYLVTLTSVATGSQISNGSVSPLFTGSTFFAGAAAAGLVETK